MLSPGNRNLPETIHSPTTNGQEVIFASPKHFISNRSHHIEIAENSPVRSQQSNIIANSALGGGRSQSKKDGVFNRDYRFNQETIDGHPQTVEKNESVSTSQKPRRSDMFHPGNAGDSVSDLVSANNLKVNQARNRVNTATMTYVE